VAVETGERAALQASTARLLRALRAVEERRGRAEVLRQVALSLLGGEGRPRAEAVLAFQAEMIATLAEAVAELQAAGAGRPTPPPVAALAEEIVELQREVAELKASLARPPMPDA
jgi:uncharacterized coiled-coil protein SlyX